MQHELETGSRARLIAIPISIALLFVAICADAQDVTAPSLKAAFIYNIAKFTEWPAPADDTKSFSICVQGDAAVGDALDRTVKNRLLGTKPISVVRVGAPPKGAGCHVLYVSGLTLNQTSQLINDLRGTPVLTISDVEGFRSVGGMVQFFFAQGQLRFALAIDSARAARLQVSSKLLPLSTPK